MNTDCAAAASRAVYDGQARRTMLVVEFASRIVNGLIRPATGRPGPHDLFDPNVRRMAVVGRYSATDVALGDNAGQGEAFCILNHRRATAACVRIACAARAAVSLGVQHDDALIGSMTSLQQFVVVPLD